MNQLIIFIKNPVKGNVKTRLAAKAGDQNALDIYHWLLSNTRKTTSQVNARLNLWYSHQIIASDEWPETLFSKYVQKGTDLGDRMLNAFNTVHRSGDKTVIIGSDCPSLTAEMIETAFVELDTKDIILGPASDGGYYLLGLKVVHNLLFENIAWSSDQVLTQTLEIAQSLGLSVSLLPQLSDIDTLEDWEQFLQSDPNRKM